MFVSCEHAKNAGPNRLESVVRLSRDLDVVEGFVPSVGSRPAAQFEEMQTAA